MQINLRENSLKQVKIYHGIKIKSLAFIIQIVIKEGVLLRSFYQKFKFPEIMIINLNIAMMKNKTTAVIEKIKKLANTKDEINHIKVPNKFQKSLA